MSSTLSSAQSIQPNILSLIFDRIEYGEEVCSEWEKAMVCRQRRQSGVESLASMAHVCRSWRAVALAYLYKSTEALVSPVYAGSNERQKDRYPPLSMAAAAGYNLHVQSVHIHLSMDGVEDGSATRALSLSALSAVTFPNATDLALSFSSTGTSRYSGEGHLTHVLHFADCMHRLFPSARNYSITSHSGWWGEKTDIYDYFLKHVAAAPQSLVYRDLASKCACLYSNFGPGIRRIHLEAVESSNFYPMVRANSETVEELVLSRCTTEYLDEMAYDCDKDHHCIYPRLTKLTINDDYTSVDGFESPANGHHFPSLSTLNIFTRWDSDFSFFVGNSRTMLTSLSFCLTESFLESLQGYVFPNLRRVCILESDYEISGIKAGAPIREFNLPFLIAPNAEQIECNIICNPRLITPNAIIPYKFSNPRLRHLVVDHFEPTLRELSRLLASLPQLTRLGILGIRGDLPAGTIYFDETIKTWLTILDVFSMHLRRLDCEWHTHECALVAILIVKLPALKVVTELMSDCSLAQYAAEIKKPMYDRYRERLSRPLFCDNINIQE